MRLGLRVVYIGVILGIYAVKALIRVWGYIGVILGLWSRGQRLGRGVRIKSLGSEHGPISLALPRHVPQVLPDQPLNVQLSSNPGENARLAGPHRILGQGLSI